MLTKKQSVAAAIACLALVISCKKATTGGSGGTIVLSIDSKEAVDHVDIHAYSPDNKETQFDFAVTGKDLTKTPISGEITPGPTIGGGTVMFVGLGYANNVLVASGRVPSAFVAGTRTQAALTLRGGIVDADHDGWSVVDGDCNDQSSAQNPFLTEVCGDNLDNNCDGSVDEGCPCTGSASQTCYAGPPATRGFGVCKDGTQGCLNGKWDTCRGSVQPAAEQCNDNQDNNCDGSVDEGCPCAPGTDRFCFFGVALVGAAASSITPPPLGECRAGTQTCVGTAWGACTGALYKKPETCNGLDDDCDGRLDNGFDADGDGYTTCGTKHESCVPGVDATLTTGTDPQFVDCDDAKNNVHPCQNNRCDDGGLDTNCSGHVKICAPSATCASLGYFDGFSGSADGAGNPRCLFNGNAYSEMCGGADSSVCSDPTAICTNAPAPGADTGFSRRICHEAAGCAGSTAPNDTLAIVSGDPHNDCGGIKCDGSAGSPAYYDGFVINATAIDCHYRADIDATNADCKANATCQVASDKCPSSSQGGVAPGSIVVACQVPAGCSGTTPLSSSDANNVDDPLGTCTTAACNTFALASWTPGANNTSICTIATADPPSGHWACVAGSCATTLAGGGCALAPTTSTTCHTECKITAACVQGAVPATHLCYDANGSAGKGGCTAGKTCYSAALNAESAASCQDCNQPFACGSDCGLCAAAKYCTGNSAPAATACVDCKAQSHCGSDCGVCGVGTYCHDNNNLANSNANGPKECRTCNSDTNCGPTGNVDCTGNAVNKTCRETAGGATCTDCNCTCQP